MAYIPTYPPHGVVLPVHVGLSSSPRQLVDYTANPRALFNSVEQRSGGSSVGREEQQLVTLWQVQSGVLR